MLDDGAVEIIGPSSSFYISQRLKLHYVDWGNEGAPPLLLIHGGRDHARSWDWVARDLRRDYHVIAPDLRGHGDSAWARNRPTIATWSRRPRGIGRNRRHGRIHKVSVGMRDHH